MASKLTWAKHWLHFIGTIFENVIEIGVSECRPPRTYQCMHILFRKWSDVFFHQGFGMKLYFTPNVSYLKATYLWLDMNFNLPVSNVLDQVRTTQRRSLQIDLWMIVNGVFSNYVPPYFMYIFVCVCGCLDELIIISEMCTHQLLPNSQITSHKATIIGNWCKKSW